MIVDFVACCESFGAEWAFARLVVGAARVANSGAVDEGEKKKVLTVSI